MRRSSIVAGTLVVVGLGLVQIAQAEHGSTQPANPVIRSIGAQLFYRDRGEFSHNVLADSTFRYWNAIIGGGSARGPVGAALVRVEVSVPRGQYLRADTLVFEARSRAGIVVSNARVLGATHAGMLTELFLLPGVGCDTVRIVAKLRRSGADYGESRATLPFACGE